MKQLVVKTLIAASIAGTAFAAQAQEVTLKVHHFLSAQTFIHTGVFEPWCAKLGKESNNRIKCQIYPAMQLGGTPPQLFDQAKDGVADTAGLKNLDISTSLRLRSLWIRFCGELRNALGGCQGVNELLCSHHRCRLSQPL